jgi:hypothetical protein
MLEIHKINTGSKEQVGEFVRIPFRLYKNHPQWVPPLFIDAEMQLNRDKHPFYEHSSADFFIAKRDGRSVGRIAALENTRHNEFHGTRVGQFYLFDCEDDEEAATLLFNRLFEWASERNLNRVIGPKGFSALDGYGLLVEGYEHRQIMTMMNYNYPYYNKLVKNAGFEKEVDYVSCYINSEDFRLPERIHSIADRVLRRGSLKVERFRKKSELRKWATRIGQTYNDAFVENWEYYPLTDNEINFLLENILTVADPRLIKVISHNDDAVGFLFGFPDLSAALQRAKGRLLPFGLFDLLLEMKRTKWIALNGAGILPEYHGRGGNAILYSEMEKTIREFNYIHADLTQVAETAVQMRRDLVNLGGKPYKNHRVYTRTL